MVRPLFSCSLSSARFRRAMAAFSRAWRRCSSVSGGAGACDGPPDSRVRTRVAGTIAGVPSRAETGSRAVADYRSKHRDVHPRRSIFAARSYFSRGIRTCGTKTGVRFRAGDSRVLERPPLLAQRALLGVPRRRLERHERPERRAEVVRVERRRRDRSGLRSRRPLPSAAFTRSTTSVAEPPVVTTSSTTSTRSCGAIRNPLTERHRAVRRARRRSSAPPRPARWRTRGRARRPPGWRRRRSAGRTGSRSPRRSAGRARVLEHAELLREQVGVAARGELEVAVQDGAPSPP